MRVTQSMLANNSLRHLSSSYERMGKLQDQLSTGKKITRPSDDPVVAMKGMSYRTNLTEIEQYQRNLSELYTWFDNSEAGLEQTNSVLQRTRELVIQGKNDTLSVDDRQSIAREIDQLIDDVVQTANTKVAGNYIYNGTRVDQQPVTKDTNQVPAIQVDQNFNAANSDFPIEVSRGVSLNANVKPGAVFSQDLFDTLTAIKDGLETNDVSDFDNLLGKLDTHMSKLSGERSELGARYNRLELVESRLGEQEVIANRILSDNEDADIERVITDLKTQESVHRAALGVGARIIQPTLMDFLR